MAWRPRDGEVDQDVFDALAEFAGHLVRREEVLAHQFGVPRSCIKAIRRLDTSVTMKELAERLHCDPSFVTKIADALEQRRLARREPNATDRRIKNLVLTPQGMEMRERLEQAMLAQMPWSYTLDVTERERLLAVIHTLNGAPGKRDWPARRTNRRLAERPGGVNPPANTQLDPAGRDPQPDRLAMSQSTELTCMH